MDDVIRTLAELITALTSTEDGQKTIQGFAEISAQLRDALVEKGFSREEAVQLVTGAIGRLQK